MEKQETIVVLNSLVEINNDRIEGYETATKETEELDLKTLFSKMVYTSQKCKAELIQEIRKLGGTAVEGTKTTGKFFRVWMDVKAAISGKDRKVILNSCEFGEDKAVETYQKALKENSDKLSNELHLIVSAQLKLIRADHDTIKTMRDLMLHHL
jgi:uncharacterized protein (TIGR02284 family)